ncbi:MAG: hypothetical protein DME33_09930 [Verrucomicrobia bacterium]|nr:MAG: hypothetical protein DME33_09930 [Verrucomicrobiota bacterium]
MSSARSFNRSAFSRTKPVASLWSNTEGVAFHCGDRWIVKILRTFTAGDDDVVFLLPLPE